MFSFEHLRDLHFEIPKLFEKLFLNSIRSPVLCTGEGWNDTGGRAFVSFNKSMLPACNVLLALIEKSFPVIRLQVEF